MMGPNADDTDSQFNYFPTRAPPLLNDDQSSVNPLTTLFSADASEDSITQPSIATSDDAADAIAAMYEAKTCQNKAQVIRRSSHAPNLIDVLGA